MALTLVFALVRPAPAQALDVSGWDSVLQQHARSGGVNYRALHEDAEARSRIEALIQAAATMNEREPLASWLNVYNAIVVHDILARYPLRSVKAVPDFFTKKHHRVAGKLRSLDDIENKIIRPRFRDARIHVALNCGARSCPALHPRAFRTSTLDRTLDRLAQRFVASRQHVRIEDNNRLRVSKLMEWFREDFERDGGSLVGWLRRYDKNKRLDPLTGEPSIAFLNYNWALNDAAR